MRAFGSYRRELQHDTATVSSAWLPVRGGFCSFEKHYEQTFGAGVPRSAVSAWRVFHRLSYQARAVMLARWAAGTVEDSDGAMTHVPWHDRMQALWQDFGVSKARAYWLIDEIRLQVGEQIAADRARGAP